MFEGEEYKNSLNKLKALLDLVQVMVLVLDREGRVTFINLKGCEILGYSEEEIIGKDWFTNFLPEDIRDNVKMVFQKLVNGELEPVRYNENPVLTKKGEQRIIAWHNSFLRDEHGNISEVISAGEDITELKSYMVSLGNLYDLARELVEGELDFVERARIIVKRCVEKFDAYMSRIGWVEPDGRVRLVAHYPEGHPYFDGLIVRWDKSPYGMGSTGRAIRSGLPQVIEDVESDSSFLPWREKAISANLKTVASFPMMSKGKVYGVLTLYSRERGFFTKGRVETFQVVANIAASSLENAWLFEESRKRLSMLQTLRNIDRTISGSLDPSLTMKVVLDEIIKQLNVDAASILRLDPWTMELRISHGWGFAVKEFEKARIRVGEGVAGKALLEKRVLWLENIEIDDPRSPLLREEGFQSYFVAPLISKGKNLGVLEIFKRSPIHADEEWIGFLETLAGQLAIAIDNMELLRNL
ncbi:MAG: GAF domain-containing protein [Synergistetes bacterium]|nr:GAF domain-containing protein [Synergistota bacterium]